MIQVDIRLRHLHRKTRNSVKNALVKMMNQYSEGSMEAFIWQEIKGQKSHSK